MTRRLTDEQVDRYLGFALSAAEDEHRSWASTWLDILLLQEHATLLEPIDSFRRRTRKQRKQP